jgi:hypothetical protein
MGTFLSIVFLKTVEVETSEVVYQLHDLSPYPHSSGYVPILLQLFFVGNAKTPCTEVQPFIELYYLHVIVTTVGLRDSLREEDLNKKSLLN